MFLVVDLFVATTRAMTALRRNKINKRTQISPIGMIETNINRRQDYFIHLDEIRPLPLCTAATSIRAYHLQLKGKQKVAGKGLLKHKQHRFGGAVEVLPGILVGEVLPDSPNPDPISDQKMSFFTLVSDVASKIHTHFQT